MRLKPQGNIDKEAQLPEGIVFRKDFIWNHIQKEQPRKRPFFWSVSATACLLFGIAFLFYPVAEDESARLPIITQDIPLELKVNEVPQVILEIEDLQELEIKVVELDEREFVSPLLADKEYLVSKDSLPDMKLTESDSQKMIKPLMAIVPTIPVKGEQELSPAALRLQKSLRKLDPNKVSDQILIVEKFNLFKEFQRYPTQTIASQNSTSILNGLLKVKNENN